MTKFDDLAVKMAQSLTRRQALKKFATALATTALACIGLTSHAHPNQPCKAGDCYPLCPKGTKCVGDQVTGCYCM